MPSPSYLLTRFLQILPTLLFVFVFTFVIVRLLPGDPALALAGDQATPEQIGHIRHELGLDRPIVEQFASFVWRALGGDFGSSFMMRTSVSSLLAERLPVTGLLTLMAAAMALFLAIPAAIISAIRRNRLSDQIIRAVFQIGLSMPAFYLGLLLLTFLGARSKLFPVGGYGETMTEHLYHLFLPALTLALSLAAVLMRSLRASMIEVMEAEYVVFARSKGLRAHSVIFNHILRNAVISTVVIFGPTIGILLGGAVVVEVVFAVPGMGRLMIDAIYSRDYPVIQGVALFISLFVMLVFLATDIAVAVLDPRASK